MLVVGSYVECVDDIGAVSAQILKVKHVRNRKFARIGDIVLVTIKTVNKNRGFFLDKKKAKKLMKGTLHRGVVVYTKQKFSRMDKSLLSFSKNGIVLVNKSSYPYAKRLRSPLPWEVAVKYPFVGSLSKMIL